MGGFHENANITKDQTATTMLMHSMLETNRGGGEDTGSSDGESKSREETIFDVAAANLTKLPENYDMEFAELRYPVTWGESMNTVLCQELERFNTLNTVINKSLVDMKNAIRGITVMSEELEHLGSDLFFGRVPAMWMDASYPSLKPLASYVTDFLERLSFLKQWLEGEAPPTYWISGFFFTQAFLTGTLQNYARKYTIPIDKVEFDFEMLPLAHEHYTSKPEDGAYVYGLFFDGARWDADARIVTDSLPKQLFSEVPVIWLKPAQNDKLTDFPNYNCPVYKTSERRGVLSTTGHSTNFVMMIRLPSDRPEVFWIEAGVALLTQLDD